MRDPKSKLPGFLTGMNARITPTQVIPGKDAMLTLTLNILPGYHIYANEPGDKFLTATTITPKKQPGVLFGKISWPRPQRVNKAMVYEKSATIRVPIRIEPGARPGNTVVALEIHAQGCNEQDCYPPARFTVSAPLRIASKPK
ncbi:MAG: protein-disulfide reductase DsbD N-terminal domain-containing protein [Armatimonas sp.]